MVDVVVYWHAHYDEMWMISVVISSFVMRCAMSIIWHFVHVCVTFPPCRIVVWLPSGMGSGAGIASQYRPNASDNVFSDLYGHDWAMGRILRVSDGNA